jgi:hypothetical protein
MVNTRVELRGGRAGEGACWQGMWGRGFILLRARFGRGGEQRALEADEGRGATGEASGGRQGRRVPCPCPFLAR